MTELPGKKLRAGLSTYQLPQDLLLDAGDDPRGLPRAALLDQGGFYFFVDWLMREHGIAPRGVLHVGGNIGQEGIPYLMQGFAKVFFIEGNPATFPALEKNVASFNLLDRELSGYLHTGRRTRFAAALAAVGEREGMGTMYLMGASTFCSTRRPKDFSAWLAYVVEHSQPEEVPDFLRWAETALQRTGEQSVRIRPLDQVLRDELPDGWSPADFNVLSLNIQGNELDALQGAPMALRHIDFIQSEKNYAEHYEGCVLAEQLDAFLAEAGFDEVKAMRMGPVGTSAYVRRRPG